VTKWLAAALAFLAVAACSDGRREPQVPSPRAVRTEAGFSIPSPAPDLPHGTLIKYLAVPDGVPGSNTYKIMYASRAVGGKPVVVTGVAVVPRAAGRARPVLTIGHGSVGLGDRCAPSVTSSLDEVRVFGERVVANGWILAATDYEGLGTPGTHPYLVGVSEGRSLLDAATAAGQLPDADASDQLLLAGYSQGGHAALWANQIARLWAPSFDIVGAFAGAPPSEIDRMLQAGRSARIRGYVLGIVAAYAATYPEADPRTYLTDEGVAFLDDAERTCITELQQITAATAASDALVRADGPTNAQWVALGRANSPGSTSGVGPVLIVHSAADGLVPPEWSDILHERLCRRGQVVERRVIQAGDHSDAGVPTYEAGLSWFEQVLRGTPAISDCTRPAR
jgi:dienelactone hydrolase